ncbi:MAG TPA: hypothetical protein VFS67_23020 [Polyangiaceae bacterium]|nr:hypothetical protein [Polyangiaceae bacterium]
MPSEGERFLLEYGNAVCGLYEPCCNAQGQGFDAGGCSEWFAKVTAAYLPDQFVPAAGAECLSALAAARALDPDRCNSVPLFADATLSALCAQAFVAPARDGAPIGGSCTLSGDCAASGDEPGRITCYGHKCILQPEGASGDGPCYAGGNVGLQDVLYTCDAAHGLYCDRANNVCTPQVGAGERCEFASACNSNAMCVGGSCKALPEQGEPCLNGIPGAGGYCKSGSCDPVTLTCGAGPGLGDACSDTKKCETGVCLDGTCARSDWQRNLNCLGSPTRRQ